ncbi:hypothetical protein EON81_15495 [bacterium]|nr:MAG: hypothetical protein EON81_15495 [bacterium]
MRNRYLPLSAAILACFGCGNGDMGETAPKQLTLEQKIQKINDTQLPQEQKDTAISMLKAHDSKPEPKGK